MNARNLGVVFGRELQLSRAANEYAYTNVVLYHIATLMRHVDPGYEFADMAGKAQCVEWMVMHAPTIFDELRPTAPPSSST